VQSIAGAVQPFRDLIHIQEPATVDGGDVLVIGRDIYVGLSTRTGPEAISQMQQLLAVFGYHVMGVPLHGCLHLKSAVTALAPDTVLINPEWVDTGPFQRYHRVEISPDEPFAANILMIGACGIYPSAFPETRARLEKHGVRLLTLDVSEIAKAEGAVTCCSLIV
jgi:dimethylargininase